MRSPLGIVSKRLSSKTLLSASTHSFGINVTIANDPIVRVAGSLILAGAGGQHTIAPFPGVVVRVPQKTDPGHGFGGS